jgi:hypothetical protein
LSLASLTRLQEIARVEDGRCGSLETSDGYPCLRHPAIGFNVCTAHGGRSSTVAKQEAERLLAGARIPAVRYLLEQMEQARQDPCPTCGYPRLSVKERKRCDTLATKILDRTGMGPKATLQLERPADDTQDLDLDALTADELTEFDELMAGLESLKSRVVARKASIAVAAIPEDLLLGARVVEAEVVPERGDG